MNKKTILLAVSLLVIVTAVLVGTSKCYAQPAEVVAAPQTEAESDLAPDFTLKDIDGNDFTLSSLRGKYVIIDFWGTWCGWCIKGMPDMKAYYAKYAGKFEIVGVDCGDTEERWKAKVAELELPWVHVYYPKDDENAPKVLSLYQVQGFPTKILVGPDGKIVKVVIGEDPAFYTFLDETFGN